MHQVLGNWAKFSIAFHAKFEADEYPSVGDRYPPGPLEGERASRGASGQLPARPSLHGPG
jgi:hypothetical protein